MNTPTDDGRKLLADAMTAAHAVRREYRFVDLLRQWLEARAHERALKRCSEGMHEPGKWTVARDFAIFPPGTVPKPGQPPSAYVRCLTATCVHCRVPMAYQIPLLNMLGGS